MAVVKIKLYLKTDTASNLLKLLYRHGSRSIPIVIEYRNDSRQIQIVIESLIILDTGLALAFEPRREKTNNLDSDQVWQKPGCAATADG